MPVPQPRNSRPAMVYRQLAIEVEAFDLLKSWQRHIMASTGRHLTNSQVLNFMLKNHPAPKAATGAVQQNAEVD